MSFFSECSDGICILDHYVCDNVLDCIDQSDERDCNTPSAINCETFYIRIRNSCAPVYTIIDSTKYTNIVTQFDKYLRAGNCGEGTALCNFHDLQCYTVHKRCVFERDIYGDPVHCQLAEHLEQCEEDQCAG